MIPNRPFPGVKKAKPNKYQAQKTTYDGVTYDSKAEARRAAELDMLKRAGEVRLWVRQVVFRLGCPENIYRVDFLVVGTNGDVWCEDVKGVQTAKFKRDMKLWKRYGPCDLRIIQGSQAETIHPEKKGE